MRISDWISAVCSSDLPDRVVPMLPETLSAGVCSLKAGEDRAAMACHLTIDRHGKVAAWRFTRALVRLRANIAYERAQAAYDAGQADEGWDAEIGRAHV